MFSLAGPTARLTLAAAVAASLTWGGAHAQAPASQAPAASPPAQNGAAAPTGPQASATDPVVARVNGQEIRLSELRDAAQNLPQEVRGMPAPVLYPMLLDQMIDQKALVAEAKKGGLDKDPTVQKQMEMASDRALQNALLTKQVGPSVSDSAVKQRYDQDIAGKAGEEEVHARHILVPTEDEAKKIIAQLDKGGDFAALAKQHSKDPGASNGGDLGWFKKGDMVPEFADAAFALQKGQHTETPVHTQFGWHVIEVIEIRTAAPPSFDQAREQLRQKMIQEGVQKAVKQARAEVSVEKFNLDGSPKRATDQAEPPPAPEK
jgi:peptidyl-prolyl cis-trans isomerase C